MSASSPSSTTKGSAAAGAATPAARRSAASSWRDPRLAIGIVIVAVSVLAGTKLFSGADESVSVWAARVDLSSGSSVNAGDLARRDVRFPSAEAANRYVSADAAVPVDATMLRAVGEGELLPRAALSNGGPADAGPVTEVPLSVPADAVPESVRTGSVVDIWVTPDPAAGGRVDESLLIFEDVEVIAAPPLGNALAPSGTRQIIIAVDEAQQTQLGSALATAARGIPVITKQG